MNSIQNKTQSAVKLQSENQFKQSIPPPVINEEIKKIVQEIVLENATVTQALPKFEETESTALKVKRSFFDKYVDRLKDFLDNAE